jgi:cell division protein FtsW
MGPRHILYDRWLLLSASSLVVLGLVMVASSSVGISEKYQVISLYYLVKQLVYLVLGCGLSLLVLRTESNIWLQCGPALLLVVLGLLLMVLVPGLGRSVNGSSRWLGVGPFASQVSELAKLMVVIYMAGFFARKPEEVQNQLSGFIKPLVVLAIASALLLLEPDFGASVVIITTVLGMMFLAGVRLSKFAILLALALAAISILAVSSPYRLARLTSFMNPWKNQFDGGYQLTQSLIAFGRGGIKGVGLGESVQKLFYLPEAHTDFVLAVLAEELGLIGLILVMVLFSTVCLRGFFIGRRAEKAGALFQAYCAYGLSLWLSVQVMINMGVNVGLLPTKGLTLPLMSAGGSSMLVSCITIALLLRIDYESRY